MKNEIIYSLNISDIQEVAEKEIGRKLFESEIKIIIEKINDNINWYDIIDNSINEMIYSDLKALS